MDKKLKNSVNSRTNSLRNWSEMKGYNSNDILVLFGELFPGGYAQGLVEEAKKLGMTILYSTVGKRNENQDLRSLTDEELNSYPRPLINVPLEAGFDLEKLPGKELRLVEELKSVKINDWETYSGLTSEKIREARQKGAQRWESQVEKYLQELEITMMQQVKSPELTYKRKVLFAHLMAGGVPRAKIILPLMNRALRGRKERFLSSETFWDSSFGQLCAQSFESVTADTFDGLVQLSTPLREKIVQHGGGVSYLAFGYHGNEVLMGGEYEWQTYTPYLQGWAKLKLEEISSKWSDLGVQTCVYNCPEILTNSSSIFTGVELSLYPLMLSLLKNNYASIDKIISLMTPDFSWEKLSEMVLEYFHHPLVLSRSQFDLWPQHNQLDQLEYMLSTAEVFTKFARDPDALLKHLSSLVIEAVGKIMIRDIVKPKFSVAWINHDVISKKLSEK